MGVYVLDPSNIECTGAPLYPSLAHFVAFAIGLFDRGLTRRSVDDAGVVDVDRSTMDIGYG